MGIQCYPKQMNFMHLLEPQVLKHFLWHGIPNHNGLVKNVTHKNSHQRLRNIFSLAKFCQNVKLKMLGMKWFLQFSIIKIQKKGRSHHIATWFK